MGHLGAKDFEGRHEIIKSKQDLIQKGLYGGLPEEDLFKGVYKNNAENIKLGRVGKHFGGGSDESEKKEGLNSLDDFKQIILDSKSFDEAFKKVKNTKGVATGVAQQFSDKYNPTGKLTQETAFGKFYEDVKGEGVERNKKNFSSISSDEIKSTIKDKFKGDYKAAAVYYNMMDGESDLKERIAAKEKLEKNDKDLSDKVKTNEARKKAIPQETHDKNLAKFKKELSSAKTEEELDKKYKEIARNDDGHTDLPVQMQNELAEYVDELDNKMYPEHFKKDDKVTVNGKSAKVGYKENGEYYVKFEDGSDGMFKESSIKSSKKEEGQDHEKYRESIHDKLFSDENFLPHLTSKDSVNFSQQLSESKSKEEVDSLLEKFTKINDKNKKGVDNLNKSEDNDISKAFELLGFSLENDIEKAEKKGEGSRGGKVIGHTKSGKPIYDANTHNAHVQFNKEEHLDAKQAHVDAMDKHSNSYWTAKTDEKRKELEAAVNYHRYQAMSHHNDAANYGKDILGKTKSGKPVFGNRKPGDNDGFTVDDHRDAAKLKEKNGHAYDAGIHESMASFKENEEKNNKVIGNTHSGKTIHAGKHPREYKDFTPEEHREASTIHDEKGDPYLSKQHNAQAKHKEDKENEDKDKNAKTHELKSLSEKPLSSQLSAITGDGYNTIDYENADGSGKLSAEPGNVIRHKKTRDLFKIPEKEPVKSEDDLKVKVGTGTFQGKDNWRVTSSNGEIGVYPKDKYSEEEAKKHYTEKFSKKDDVKKSDNNDIQKAFEILGLSASNDIEKGGEGSKGGKIIGHTKSGKPIYESHDHDSHKDFTDDDHHDAVSHHLKKMKGMFDKRYGKKNSLSEGGILIGGEGSSAKDYKHHEEQAMKHTESLSKNN